MKALGPLDKKVQAGTKLYDKNKLIFVGKNHSDFILIRDTAMSQYISGPGGSMS
jgi:hypothetical protein